MSTLTQMFAPREGDAGGTIGGETDIEAGFEAEFSTRYEFEHDGTTYSGGRDVRVASEVDIDHQFEAGANSAWAVGGRPGEFGPEPYDMMMG